MAEGEAAGTGTADVARAMAPLVDAHFHVYERSMPLADGAWHHPGEMPRRSGRWLCSTRTASRSA